MRMSELSKENEMTVDALLTAGHGHVHMLGACGIGMAGLAYLLSLRGFRVSGCDQALNSLAEWLAQHDISVSTPHDPKHISAGVDWIIRSPAVSGKTRELSKAREMGLPVLKRGEVLPRLLPGRRSIAVCGTHGKTTTASLVVQILRHAGLNPGWCIGGENESLSGVAGGGDGKLLVVEADESDGTLALYKPDIAIVTNIEFDHMEHFESTASFKECFRTLLANTGGRVVFCADDPGAVELCSGAGNGISYGFSRKAAVKGLNPCSTPDGQSFVIETAGEAPNHVELSVPGIHNAGNALAAIAACLELRVPLPAILSALRNVSLPRRRFERIVDRDDVTVISDYAHHPSEIAALVKTSRILARPRLRAVFQPHRYTRTLALGEEFPSAFEGVDELVLTPVYAASEPRLSGGTTWDLYRHFRASSGLASRVSVAQSLEQAWDYIRQTTRVGDSLLVVGAGDVEKIAHWARDEYGADGPGTSAGNTISDLFTACPDSRFVADEPLERKTTLKVGGRADVWAEVGTAADLRALHNYCADNDLRFSIIGGGSNVLVSDLGVRGVVARLTGPEFSAIYEENGVITVGAGMALSALLDWVSEHEWGGLEFLEGIPGTVGGAMRMNAGAYGDEFGNHVDSITVSGAAHKRYTIRREDLHFGYRCCRELLDNVLTSVKLALESRSGDEIARNRREFAERRRWMRGLRSAGSVFKNPGKDTAGRLIDSLGLKGADVGGARISDRHANLVVTEDGATASDVLALIELVRLEVHTRTGVLLEQEIVGIQQ